MTRVQTKHQGDNLAFIQDSGAKALHPAEFTLAGREYYFLGGMYYDLDEQLTNHIFHNVR